MRNRLTHIAQQTGILDQQDLLFHLSQPPYNIHTLEELFTYQFQSEHAAAENPLSLDTISDIKLRLLQRFAIPMRNGRDMLDMHEHIGECHTSGCTDIDRLLSGGFFGGQVTEVVGRSGTGKTQLCMTAALACVSSNMVNTVLYIDTTNAVSASRMKQMFLHRKREQTFVGHYLAQHPEMHGRLVSPFPTVTEEAGQVASSLDALSRVFIRHAFDYLELLDLLKQLAEDLKSSNRRRSAASNHIRMVVIDSIASVIGPILASRDSHQFTAQIGELIRRISKQYHIAFIVTNYTVVNIDRSSSGSGSVNRDDDAEAIKGALGASWTRVPDVRLWLHNNDATGNRVVRTATVQVSTNGPTDTLCQFVIDNAGVKTPLPPFIQQQIDELPIAQT